MTDNYNLNPSLSAELLADIKEVFELKCVERISTAELIEALCTDDEKSWSTHNRGKPITPRQFAKRLTEYGIRSKTLRIDYKTPKGFELSQFEDAFLRYLAPSPSASATPPQSALSLEGTVADNSFVAATDPQSATRKAALTLNCGVVADTAPLPACEKVEWLEERAAVAEYEGGLSRDAAEAQATKELQGAIDINYIRSAHET